MIDKVIRLIPRRGWWWLGDSLVLASLVPWYFDQIPLVVRAIVPVATFAICTVFTPRRAWKLWSWSVAGLVIFFAVRQPLTKDHWLLLLATVATLTLLAVVPAAQSRVPWSVYRRHLRLTKRLRRQASQLHDYQQESEFSKRAVERLKIDRQALLEHLPVHVVQKDRDGRFIFVSQSFCQLVGRDYDEIIGKTDFDLFPETAARKFVQDDRRVMETGEPLGDVEQAHLPGGKTSYMQIRKAPLRDAEGNIIGVQGIFWDVTEEHLHRQRMQQIESLAHALIHAALDAVLIVDSDGHVLDSNPAAASILGYSDIDTRHPPLGAILHTDLDRKSNDASLPDNAALAYHQTPIATILQAATGTRIEAKLRRQDGTWFDAEFSAHPLDVDGSGGWAIFIRDITRRKRAQAELVAAKELAERANAAKSEFVANVSHELRTPLTAILGLLQLLDRSPLTSRQREYLELARLSANNLLTLINDLLDFSKIEAGKLEIDREPFLVRECVEDAVRAISARAQYKGLEVLIDCPDDVPVEVVGDAHRVRQILLNLVGNAIKFTDRGEIRVVVRFNPSPASANQDDGQLRIEVHDTGTGIPLEKRQVIFEAFRQGDSGTTRKFGGTGLGLTICRDLVLAMHGNIGVEDARTLDGRPQQGSCFYFEIPVEVTAPARPTKLTLQFPQQFVIAADGGSWVSLMQRDIQALGLSCVVISLDDLFQRRPAALFSAGNNTVVLADYRELTSRDCGSAPVVQRWILLTQIYSESTHQLPLWLSYASIRWLSRPVKRNELVEALTSGDRPGAGTLSAAHPSVADQVQQKTPAARILLVEDSPISQTVLGDMLRGEGHQVDVVGDGVAAIEKCTSTQYDLVLMDVQMPGLDGMEAARRIRAIEQEGGPHQTIIALTAHATPADRQRCLDAGMDGFLVKPITLETLQETIANVLARRRAEPGKQQACGEPQAESSPSVAPADPANSAANPSSEPSQEHGTPATTRPQGQDPEDYLEDAPDYKQLVASMGGNADLADDVLQLLSQEAPRLGRLFQQAVRQRNQVEARRAAHTMKSNARHVLLHDVASYAEQLEESAQAGDWPALDDAADRFKAVCDLVEKWARQTKLQNQQ